MGFLSALAGYMGGKAAVAILTASLYIGAIGATAVSTVCPAVAPVAILLFEAGNASGAMLISPFDPITAAVTTVAAAAPTL